MLEKGTFSLRFLANFVKEKSCKMEITDWVIKLYPRALYWARGKSLWISPVFASYHDNTLIKSTDQPQDVLISTHCATNKDVVGQSKIFLKQFAASGENRYFWNGSKIQLLMKKAAHQWTKWNCSKMHNKESEKWMLTNSNLYWTEQLEKDWINKGVTKE